MGTSIERNNHLVQNWKCILICCMALDNCQYDFDTAAIGGFQAMVGFLRVFGYADLDWPRGWNIVTRSHRLPAVADQQSQRHDSKLAYQIPLAALYAIPATLIVLIFFIPDRWARSSSRGSSPVYSTVANLGGSMVGMYRMYKHLDRLSMMMLGTACAGLSKFASVLAYTIQPGAPPLPAPSPPPSPSSTGACPRQRAARLSVLTVSLATGVNYFFSLFLYFLLPEIKGRSLEEIDELFQNRVSAKGFPGYEYITSTRAREIAIQDLKLDGTIREERAEKVADV
ncbi:hypothetical protein QBC33DRAFT_512426 [Phialemonium atrogriseum]|uniref:Major facilitator superfamily (MFS) profile domain-containing protein n=1 Tax=Phialemonium atrogriseum TaxID=1093897 RepID=A0AAJ0C815_9PEZI|nr:uncharacterized protein QBC33DRAFT_512426 [Phialemonium atrogriseum]KAK1770688.1 hypothetical protein QBC33DRAFT_512426 [Phialemonium atrogriseum]